MKATGAPVPVASAVRAPGSVNIGGVVSTTVTFSVAVPTWPRESVALQVTIVVPEGNGEPVAGVQVAVSRWSTVSTATAEKVTGVPAGAVASTLTLPLVVTAGGKSTTETVERTGRAVSWASVAVQFTVVVPTGKTLPDAGVQTGGTAPSTRSVAVAVKLTGAPEADRASTPGMSAGRVSAGAVVSSTITWT